MRGQWHGTYSGSEGRKGQITLNIDETPSGFAGIAYLFEETLAFPVMVGVITTDKKSAELDFESALFCVDPFSHNELHPAELATKYPGFTFPKKAKVKGRVADDTISIEWQTDIQTKGVATLAASRAAAPSEYVAQEMDWPQFRAFVAELPPRKFIFRGQEQGWRLRTSFHRHNRANLVKFGVIDIPTLHRILSARTRHIYNLADAEQNGAFHHLIQHHGYPTPLLDWTYSPFVAAFFAYRKISPLPQGKLEKPIRIFVLDQEGWRNDWTQFPTVKTHVRHFSLLDFIAIDNDRMVPQQALSSVSTVDDIESYIRGKEVDNGKAYLRMIDMPASSRSQVMKDLSVMGITAGSMFPGLEGSCEEIKERLFNF